MGGIICWRTEAEEPWVRVSGSPASQRKVQEELLQGAGCGGEGVGARVRGSRVGIASQRLPELGRALLMQVEEVHLQPLR